MSHPHDGPTAPGVAAPVDLTVDIGPTPGAVVLPNPLMTASGCAANGPELDRFFDIGELGAFVTKTNLSEEEFGEGSFDKGITIRAPLAWAIGTPTKRTVGGTLGSLNRDGGQRLRVDGRLYDTVRDSHGTRMYDGWGKFWR